MSYKVHVRGAAELDVALAQDWYEGQRPGLGSEFNAEFGRIVARLEQTPLIYPAVHRTVRRAVLRRFPFLVWFRVEASTVIVLACTHGKLDPDAVSQRLR